MTSARATVSLVAGIAPLAGLVAVSVSADLPTFGYIGLFALSLWLAWTSAKRFLSWLNPASAFFAAWSLQFGLLALPLFDYTDDPRLEDLGYIGFALVIAGAGFRLGAELRRGSTGRIAAQSTPESSETSGFSRRGTWLGIATAFGLLGLLGQFAILYDASVITGLSLGERIDDGTLVRQLHFENLEMRRVGPFAIAGHFAGPLSYLCLAASFAVEPRIRQQPRVVTLLVGANVVLITLNSLFASGGRLGLILAVAVIVLAKGLFRENPIGFEITAKRLMAFALVGAFGWYLSTSYLAGRSNNTSPQQMQAQLRTELQPLAASVAHGNDSMGYFLVSVNYFASPTPSLLRYLQLGEEQLPGPYYGHYSFHPITQPVVGRVVGDTLPLFAEMRGEIFAVMTDYGFAGNVWATGIRDLMVDFGRVGALLALFLLTVIVGALFAAACRRTARPDTRMLAMFLVIASAWFPFSMLTVIGFFLLPVIYLVVMIAIRGRRREPLPVARFPALERRLNLGDAGEIGTTG